MKPNQRTKKLAAILIEASGENSGAVRASLQQVDLLIRKDARFRSLLQSKRVTQEQKTDILREVLADSCHTVAIEFLGLMTAEKSVQVIRQVIKAYDDLYKEQAGIVSVQAQVAHAMDSANVDILKKNLQKVMNKKPDLKIEVDENLLGGIKLRIENTFLDASLQGKLSRLQGELLQS
ncbi:MAG: ATP synthase F1 subunit delta [Candidatus Marinimicrobia bacterium]|nr:ATP synthase F1 subunit delta [Candidatus Neomarinimicrobiota bacterium]